MNESHIVTCLWAQGWLYTHCAYQREYVRHLFDRSNSTTTLLYVLVQVYVNDSLFLCFCPVFHSWVLWCKRKPLMFP